MREFWIERAAPLAFVCAVVLGLTLLLFGMPPGMPPVVHAAPAAAAAGAAAPAEIPSAREVSEVMARALRNLELARAPRPSERQAPPEAQAMPGFAPPPRPAPVTGPAPAAATPEPTSPSDPGLLDAVAALGNAIKAVHEVRTEEDLVTAEARLHEARVQMEASCKSGASPLCDGARQMESLGY